MYVCVLKKNYLTTAEFQQIVRIWRDIYMISTNCVHSCYMWRHFKVSFSVNICINFIMHATLQLCPYCHVFISSYCIAVVFRNFFFSKSHLWIFINDNTNAVCWHLIICRILLSWYNTIDHCYTVTWWINQFMMATIHAIRS